MSAETASPTLDIKLRAVRAIPSLGLATGEVLDLNVTPANADGFNWFELSTQLQSGGLESLSPPPTCDAIQAYMEAIL